MRADSLTMELSLAGVSVGLVSCKLSEAISQVSEAEIEVATPEALDVAGLVQSAAQLSVLADGQPLRTWSLIVGAAAFERVAQGSLRYRVRLYSPLWLLSHAHSTRKFRNLNAQQIVASVLAELGVAQRWLLSRVPPLRKYCVQYRESHHAFVNRLLESEGVYHSTDAAGGVVLEDRSAGAATVDGEATLPWIPAAAALDQGALGILSFGQGARVGSGRVTVNDYNWKTPRVDLLQSRAADSDTELELYDYPAGYRKPEQGALLAQIRLEAARARTRFVGGEANVPSLAPARRFSLEGVGDYFLTAVVHEMFDPRFGPSSSEQQVSGYRCHFEAIAASTPYRPQPVTPRPVVQGCHTVMVRGPAGEEIHTDQHGRFRAQFHWDREAQGSDADSRWIRKLQESATSMNLARVGWEVSVAYIDGDPDRPIGLTRNINGLMRPAYPQPAEKQMMTIKTPTYPGGEGFNEIRLDDRAGSMRFDVRAERDLHNDVLRDRSLRIEQDHARLIVEQLSRQVGRDQRVEVGRDQTLAVDGDSGVQVEGSRDEYIAGDQRVRVDGNLSTTVGAADQEHVGSLRLSIVGHVGLPDVVANAKKMVPKPKDIGLAAAKGAWRGRKNGGGWSGAKSGAGSALQGMIPSGAEAANKLTGGLAGGDLRGLAQGAISRAPERRLSRTVGGVHVVASAEAISTVGKYAFAETIGGAKITAVKGNISQDGGKMMALTVGGLVCRKSAADIRYGADAVSVMVAGVASLDAGEGLAIRGTTITLEAAGQLTLRAGQSQLTLSPATATLSGTMRLEAGESATFSAGTRENLTRA